MFSCGKHQRGEESFTRLFSNSIGNVYDFVPYMETKGASVYSFVTAEERQKKFPQRKTM